MIRSLFAVVMLSCQPVFAQLVTEPHPSIAFEVASIREQTGRRVLMGFSSSGSRLRLDCYTSEQLISEAFNLNSYQISWSPGVDPQHAVCYDISAKAPDGSEPTRDDFRNMLQNLLTERFSLKFHTAQRAIPAYALTLAKNGPKLKPSAEAAPEHGLMGVHGRNQTIEMPRDTLDALASQLQSSFVTDRPVVNRTGLPGTYDIKLEATPEWRLNSNPQAEDISIFTAVQEQLGLKLVPVMQPMKILVIDHVERPTAN